MRRRTGLIVLVLLLGVASLSVVPAVADPLPRVPPGFAVSLFATGAGPITSLAFGKSEQIGYGVTQTTLYVTDYAGGRVLAMDDISGVAGPLRVFASGLRNPLGVTVAATGAVYVADSEAPRDGPFGTRSYGRVWRLVDTDGDGTADKQDVVLKDLPNGRHNTNGLAFGRDGLLYVANGNSTDDGVEGGEPEAQPWSGSVVRVDPDVTDVSLTDLKPSALVARGMRNLYDLAFSPFDRSKLFIPTNGVDDARPASEEGSGQLEDSDDLLYVADSDDRDVEDFGFPSCLYNVARQENLKPYDNPHPDVEKKFGPCPKSSVDRPISSFGLHVSADGLAFQTSDAWGKEFTNDLFVTEFGNFFGDEVTGHRVVRVELNGSGNKVVRQSEFLSGAVPLDLAFHDGAMYVADFSGTIFRVVKLVDVPDAVEVQINGFQFLPQALVIPEGTTVRWINNEVLGIQHKVAAIAAVTPDGQSEGHEINSKDLAVGKAHSFRFETPGTWVYTCTVNTTHEALMHGVITVVPAGN